MSGWMLHLPVLSVMGCFLGAFLIEIFGYLNKVVRGIISVFFTGFAVFSAVVLFKPVMLDGEVISYWMGNWEPVSGYAIGIGYEIDQLNYFFIMLAVFTMAMCLIYSFRNMERNRHLGHYYTLFLMLSGSVLGMIYTGDIFNMYVMVEIMTFAAVALTAFRNYKRSSIEAAYKYLVLGSIGSSFMLIGIALVYRQCHTLNMAQLASILSGETGSTPTAVLAFAMLFIGMGVKSYIVPFHTPAVDAYKAAPTPISMAFASMVNKAGVYGMIRLMFVLFRTMDKSTMQILLVAFGTVTMFVGVTMALAQHDFKRLLAFHSVSQIGYVITAAGLGTALGLSSGLFHAMNHTLFKGLLFLCAGAVLYATDTVTLDDLGGLSKKMPKTTICFLIGAFSIAGLPPFNGFISKWQIYQATYQKALLTGNFFYLFVTVVAVVTSVMTLASFIKVTQSVFFGQVPERCKDVKEVTLSMRIPMWIMAALCVAVGIGGNVINKYLLLPATYSALNPVKYVDAMMGQGYAAAAGMKSVSTMMLSLDYMNPIMWLVLFGVIFVAVIIVALTSKPKQFVEYDEMIPDGKNATFFGGEKYTHSHVGGNDMFWGFKKNWHGYFDRMQKLHSGNVNDYALWIVVAAALVVIFMFIFLVLV